MAFLHDARALLGQPSFLAFLAEARGAAGDVDRRLECVAQGLGMVERTGEVTGPTGAVLCERLLSSLRSRDGAAVESDVESLRLLNLHVTAFFKHHLEGDRAYARFLSADFAATEPAIRLQARREPR